MLMLVQAPASKPPELELATVTCLLVQESQSRTEFIMMIMMNDFYANQGGNSIIHVTVYNIQSMFVQREKIDVKVVNNRHPRILKKS